MDNKNIIVLAQINTISGDVEYNKKIKRKKIRIDFLAFFVPTIY